MTTSIGSDWLATLCRARAEFALPRRAHERAAAFADQLLAFLFPHFAPEVHAGSDDVTREASRLRADTQSLIAAFVGDGGAVAQTEAFLDALRNPVARPHDRPVCAAQGAECELSAETRA